MIYTQSQNFEFWVITLLCNKGRVIYLLQFCLFLIALSFEVLLDWFLEHFVFRNLTCQTF